MPPRKEKGKRKAVPSAEISTSPNKRARNSLEKVVEKQAEWPPVFHKVLSSAAHKYCRALIFRTSPTIKLFKVFKALNTVLAFCSSRKNLAVSFAVVRSSVEDLLKQPLELERVAELKALLPDLITFAYIPRNEHLINDKEDGSSRSQGGDGNPGRLCARDEGEDHILVLDFLEVKRKGGGRGVPAQSDGSDVTSFGAPSTLSPLDVQRLILKRNTRFEQAVNELLKAVQPPDDPTELLKLSAREHIPVNPSTIHNLKLSPDKRQRLPKPDEREPMSIVVNRLMEGDDYKGQVAYRKTFEPRKASSGTLTTPISATILKAFKTVKKIESFYSHQAEAISAIMSGHHTIVSTSTASGKSAIYQAPLLHELEIDRSAKAMFVYPTKALAQDQKAALEQLLYACGELGDCKVATYDGDTPKEQRSNIRETASVIFTNFDMIHASILPHEDAWRSFLKDLRLLVVDELHYYSGVFGSHVAQVMRRFRRICAAVGNRRLRFVSCSATIADPFKHMKAIFGVETLHVVDADGSPEGRKDCIIWNPPLLDSVDPTMGRDNALHQGVLLIASLMKQGVRTIMFCKVRKTCELAMRMIRTDLTSEGRFDILEKVVAYRGGYSAQDRRRIEREAFDGHLLGIIATNALELGVDIGVLDAVIMLGFPYTIANLRQQSGRAGRRSQDSLTILVTDNNPIDQHYVNNPEELFNRNPEPLVIDLDSPVILEAHLQCAAQEMPLSLDDETYFGSSFRHVCSSKLVRDSQGWFHTNPRFLPYPSTHISLRGAQEVYYTVLDVSLIGASTKILEEIEFSRALFETYEGGVFIHQGMTFIVKEVNHETRVAKVEQTEVNWTTKPRDFTNIDALQTYRIREIKGSSYRAFYGSVDIQTTVFGFFKMRGSIILDAVALDTPPFQRQTTGWWIDLSQDVLEILRSNGLNIAEGIHAASHAILNQFDMKNDVRTECKLAVKEYKTQPSRRKRPARLMFYDAEGRGGAAVKAFDHASRLVHASQEVVEACRCASGCYRCIQSPLCKENNDVSSKLCAQVILRGILSLQIDLSALPEPVERYDPQMDTIIEAPLVPQLDDVQVESFV